MMDPYRTRTALFQSAAILVSIVGISSLGSASEPFRSAAAVNGIGAAGWSYDTTGIYAPESDIDKEYFLKANDAIYFLYLAQKAFGSLEYRNALLYAGKSLSIETSAEAYGLLGSTHYFLADLEKAKQNWLKAIELEKDIPVPDYIVPLVTDTIQKSR